MRFFYCADRYDLKGKEYLKTGGKFYAVDFGLRQMVLGNTLMDAEHMLCFCSGAVDTLVVSFFVAGFLQLHEEKRSGKKFR